MFKVLIIDDEPMVRKRLRTLLDWNKAGFVILGEAEDGEEGLEKIINEKPDVIFTDIRMPVIDGLELIKTVKREYPEIRIVILSGYSDFKYAHEAIKYGVKNYLLKPVDEDEVEKVLLEIKTELETNITREYQMQEARKALKEKWAAAILNNTCTSNFMERAEQLGIDTTDKGFGVILVEIDEFDNAVNDDTDEDFELKRSMILTAINEMNRSSCKSIVVEESINRFSLLILFDCMQVNGGRLKEMGDDICTFIRQHLHMTVTIGVSDVVHDITAVHGCYKEAKTSLEGKFLIGKNRVIKIEDIIGYQNGNTWDVVFGWDKTVLYKAIGVDDHKAIEKEIKQLFGIIRNSKASSTVINSVIIENIMGIGREVKKTEGDITQIVGENFSIEKMLKNSKTLDELEIWFASLCFSTADYLNKLRKNRPGKVSEKVINYIREHYSENINLKSIAKVVYMNPVYLGQLFRNDAGVSFNDFLTAIRIEHAAELLMQTGLTVYEISEKVGYNTPGYFFKAFKKIHGCSPLEYRELRNRS